MFLPLIAPQKERLRLSTGYGLWLNIRSRHIILYPACANPDNAIAGWTTKKS
jgi:hypothetical protein